jgi:general secretion pathway protein E
MEPPYLDVITPAGRQQVSLARLPLTIGRASQNQLVIEDLLASRQHCVIEKNAQGIVLRDLNSRNGTRINEQKVESAVLKPGDIFTIGKIKFRYVDIKRSVTEAKAPATTAAPSPSNSLTEALRQLAGLDTPGSPQPDQLSLVDTRGNIVHAQRTTSDDENEKIFSESITVLRLLLLAAMRTRASDIHIEPKGEKNQVRLRVDGIMVDAATLPNALAGRVYGSIKVLAEMDITQSKAIQDGHFSANLGLSRRVDYRVSFTPTMYGQKLVVRVLDMASAPQYLDQLNLPPWMLQDLRKTSRQSAGMILVCGPTGSGKTTTLYSILRDVDVSQRNVITIEDPVEYQIEGVTQMPIDTKQGNTFHSMLRSVLRQDPDVLLVGEIRDAETAATAMQAAMTGHLVLSTVHSKDTVGTIFRLLDLGVEPFLVASSLNLILAQRLIRLLCPHCKGGRKPTPSETMQICRPGSEVDRIYYAVGCPRCFNTGYNGRRALFELLTMNDSLRDIVLKKPTMSDIRDELKRSVFTSLQDSGHKLVADGTTSMEEVERVAGMT